MTRLARTLSLARTLALSAATGTAVGASTGPVSAQEPRPPSAATPAPPHAPLRPDTVLSPTGGPRVVILAAPEEGVAALRLAIPLREGATEAGAGWLLQTLGQERMETLARPVGARVSASRTPWGIAYAAVGAAADFEYLAYLLREAVAAPDVESPGFAEARRRLQEETAGTLETPRARIASRLRQEASGGVPPIEGTPASVEALDPARVLEVWRRSHQSSTMTLVVSAPVVPEVILAATRGMGAAEEDAAPPLDAPLPSRPASAQTQSLRSWSGAAWYGSVAEDPHGPVAALLVAESLRRHVDGYEASVELWELPDRWVLAVVGAAYGRRNVTAMRRTLSDALRQTRDGLTAEAVADAVSQVRGELLLRSRTPAGLVALVGRSLEASPDPGAATRYVNALQGVDLTSLRAFLDELLARGAVTAEVTP